jgi:hypothetical protein
MIALKNEWTPLVFQPTAPTLKRSMRSATKTLKLDSLDSDPRG